MFPVLLLSLVPVLLSVVVLAPVAKLEQEVVEEKMFGEEASVDWRLSFLLEASEELPPLVSPH